MDVMLFVREIIESFEELRVEVLTKLIESLPEIKNANVFRVALWVLGEYATSSSMRAAAIDTIKECLGTLPFREETPEEEKRENEEKVSSSFTTNVTVLADGTYATQTMFTEEDTPERDAGPSILF